MSSMYGTSYSCDYYGYHSQYNTYQHHHVVSPPMAQHTSVIEHSPSFLEQNAIPIFSYDTNQTQTLKPKTQSNLPVAFTPPVWATCARGESRLEPIDSTCEAHKSIDLTTQRWYRVGRSPNSHIPLLHATSSRNHAIIFHHPSGACYIVDTNSIHGTFVDGIRVHSHPNPPRKVRRGALIRFGGPGAPTFMLKSFSHELHNLVHDLRCVANSGISLQNPDEPNDETKRREPAPVVIPESFSEEEDDVASKSTIKSHYFRHPHHWIHHVNSRGLHNNKKRPLDILACLRGDGGGVACIAEMSDTPSAALLLLNTRLNALGENGVCCTVERKHLTEKASNQLKTLSSMCTQVAASSAGTKRIRHDDVSTTPPTKKLKSILCRHSAPNTFSASSTRVTFNKENEFFFPPSITPDHITVEVEKC